MSCEIPEELVGFGVMLQYQDPLTDDWVTVGGTTDLDTPDDTTEAIDATSNDSGGRYKKMIPSPLSALGEVSYEVNFRWSLWQTLQAFKASRRTLAWRVVLNTPEQTYMQYCAWIKNLKATVPMTTLVKGTLGLQPTGAPTWGQLN
mgnify:CR=1 FL=1